jgi:hypothetical protein
LQETYPTIIDDSTPIKISGKETMWKSFVSMIVAPMMAGTERRKEYFMAVSAFTFLKIPTLMVEPLLDIPGRMATP